MANPQKENGHIDIANELAEVLAKTQLSGYESRYLWVLWRKTYGWHKKDDRISNSQFVVGTNIKKTHIWRTEQRLIQKNIVTKNGNKLSFNKDYSQWKELPKLVTAKKVTKNGIGVTKNGAKKLPKMVDTKETKKLLQKKVIINNTEEPKEYGKPEINKMLKDLKLATGRDDFKDTQKWQRFYANLFVKLMAKLGVDDFKRRFAEIMSDQFRAKNCGSLKYLYGEMKSVQTSSGLSPPKVMKFEDGACSF